MKMEFELFRKKWYNNIYDRGIIYDMKFINYTIQERGDKLLIIVLNEKTGESLAYEYECLYEKTWDYDMQDKVNARKKLNEMIEILK